MVPKWLEWARSLQAIAQNGLTFSENEFDVERFTAINKIASEIMASYSSVSHEVIADLFSDQAGYATPRVDVRGVVFRDESILLVKEKADGGWTLPGGWADPNEPPSLATEREVFEESGFEVRAVKLLALFDRDRQGHYPPHPFHVYKIFFLCEILGGRETVSYETEAVGFFREEEIPELSHARVTERQLHLFFDKYRKSDFSTEFD